MEKCVGCLKRLSLLYCQHEVIPLTRTKLADRKLPDYTRGEEIANMTTHIVGGAFGVVTLALCTVFPVINRNYWALASGIFYGLMMIFLYAMSSIYHGIIPERPKKVMQVIDHCSIFALIAGSYAPVLCTGVREHNPRLALGLTILVTVGVAVGVTFTAIDFKRYAVISMTGYFATGWAALLCCGTLYRAYGVGFLAWLVGGGAAYTVGMIFFALGIKRRYFHSIFHLFILAGTALQFVAIFKYCILG